MKPKQKFNNKKATKQQQKQNPKNQKQETNQNKTPQH